MKAGFSVKTVWYLHGFASSSESDKARLVKDYFARELSEHNLVVPDLPYTPQEAWQELQQLAAVQPPDFIIGSSLGGFLATALAEQFACPAALINPAVRPHLLLANHLGRYWHPVRQQHYEVTEQHLPQLAALAVEHIEQPAQLLVLLQTGDEVLDYRQALAFYANCQLDVEEGGDHSYQNLSRRLPDIANFGRLT